MDKPGQLPPAARTSGSSQGKLSPPSPLISTAGRTLLALDHKAKNGGFIAVFNSGDAADSVGRPLPSDRAVRSGHDRVRLHYRPDLIIEGNFCERPWIPRQPRM